MRRIRYSVSNGIEGIEHVINYLAFIEQAYAQLIILE